MENATIATPKVVRVVGELTPHSPPLEMNRSNAVSEIVNRTVPTASNAPPVRLPWRGTTAKVRAKKIADATAEAQKIAPSPPNFVKTPDRGRPVAEPIPIVPLINATPVAAR